MQNILAPAIKESLATFLNKDPIYKKFKSRVTSDMVSMAHKAIEELDEYKPNKYNWWFCVNHERFKSLKQYERTLMNEIMHNFLTSYARGKVIGAKKRGRKQKNISKEREG